MKVFKSTLTMVALLLFISVSSCQKDKYPELGDGIFAEIITNKGTMVAKLSTQKTPVTVANFVGLAEGSHPLLADDKKGKPFYNGLVFHRVMDKFMIQGGDPEGTGRGGPGYKFGDEFDDSLKHDKLGILSMANSGPSSNGSQFFIIETPQMHLNNRHSVFGELVLGMDVLDSISNVKVTKGSNKPVEDVVMTQVNIIRQGFEARKFDAAKTWETELPLLEEKKKKKAEEARIKAEAEKKIAEAKKAEAAAKFSPTLEDYKSKATAFPSGLLAYNITKSDGAQAKSGDNVKVYYEGYFTDGVLFDSNRKEIEEAYGMLNEMKDQRGLYAPMPMKITPDAAIITGFKEAAASMKVGEKTYFYIPSHLAYGESGRGMIKPNTDLIFILELVEIVK
ncbi:MAG: peptidylprolyl isomerase [Flavobacteriaceae bacterium]|nr:peptidylprolyl isomerase [Flavobacteriaceae bacterium]